MKEISGGSIVVCFIKKIQEVVLKEIHCCRKYLGIEINALLFAKPKQLLAFFEADFRSPAFRVLFDDGG